MGKSITAALIGILSGQGHFSLDDPAPIEEWQGTPKSEIRIKDLLRMSSCLGFSRGQDDDVLDLFVSSGRHDEIEAVIKQRFADVTDTISASDEQGAFRSLWDRARATAGGDGGSDDGVSGCATAREWCAPKSAGA